MGNLDDAVGKAQKGDVRAFEQLYTEVQPRLLRYLTTLVGAEAPDVCSETWLQVTRGLGRFRGSGDDFRGWVVGIGRHRALDHLRAAGRRPSDAWDPALLPDDGALGSDATAAGAEEAAGTQRALRLIATLPRDQAEAVLLRFVVGLDAPAAAKVLGKRPGAVRMATSRGLARLAATLEEPGVTAEGLTAL